MSSESYVAFFPGDGEERNQHVMGPIALVRAYRNVPGLQISQPLGILSLAGWLREHGIRVPLRLVDMRLQRMTPADLVRLFRFDVPSVVGISALSLEAPVVHELAASLKAAFPGTLVVVGGPYATTSPELVIADTNIDVAVVGEGEETFLELLQHHFSGASVEDIAGTVVLREGKPHHPPRRPFIEDLDRLPMPAWDLLDIRDYFGRVNFNRIYAHRANMTIMTSRGCPFQCAYCHNVFGTRFRARSPAHVLAEMNELYKKWSIREFLIIDDTFNLNRIRAKTICDQILEHDLSVSLSFPNGLKADVMDIELIDKLKKCGAYRICYGVESANPRILDLITRRMNIEKTREVIDWTADRSILTHGFFMLGFPTETEAEMQDTIRFALQSKLHTASFFVVVPFPGTRLYDLSIERLPQQYIDGFYHKIDNVISNVPKERVRDLIRGAYRRFYLHPWRLYNILRLTPKNIDFVRSSLEFLSRAT